MSKAGKKMLDAAHEALSIAKGERPAARITVDGHAYVPAVEIAALTARAEKAEAERDDAMTAIARVREALTYYADPLAWMQARGVTDKHIPDFYSELCFGEMAQDALSTFQQCAEDR